MSSIGSGDYIFRHYGIEYITKPTVTSSLTYTGQSQAPTITGFNPNTMTQSGTASATNAGSYTVSFTPKTGYAWSDGSGSGTLDRSWSIAKAAGTLSISPASISLSTTELTKTTTVTSNCLGTISVGTLSGITTLISGTTITITGDGLTEHSSSILTISVTPDDNHTAPADASLTVNASYYIVATIPTPVGTYIYDGTSQQVSFTGYDPAAMTKSGTETGINATTYTTYFDLNSGYIWSDGTFTQKAVNWEISPKSISGAAISLGTSLIYNGSTQTQTVSSVIIDGLYATYTVEGNSKINAGNYTLTCTGTGNFTGTETAGWTLIQKDITSAVITLSESTKTYNGSSQSVTINSVVIDSLSATFTTGGTSSATNAGTYTVTATGNGNFTGTASTDWYINPLSLTIPSLTNKTKTYTGSSQSPTINSFNSTYETQTGTTSSTSAGGPWTITWSLKNTTNTKWSDNTITDKTDSWVINKASLTIPSLSNKSFTYSGNTCTPTVNNYNSTYENQTGTTSSTNAGTYYVYWDIKDTSNYQWSDSTTAQKSDSWVINKAASSVTAAPTATGNKTAGESVAIINAGTCTGGTLYYKAAGSSQTSYGTGIPTTTSAGTYTVYYYVMGDSNHSDTAEASMTSTIALKLSRIGGRIFYINSSGGSGATYTFYDSSGNVISTQTVSGLANAYYYKKTGTSSADKFYVYDTTLRGTARFDSDLYSATSDGIGVGRSNTETIINSGSPGYTGCFSAISSLRSSSYNECTDWYIGSKAEIDQLNSAGLTSWFGNDIWSSVQRNSSSAYFWKGSSSTWSYSYNSYDWYYFAMRSF